MPTEPSDPSFLIPLPGGRVARVPVTLLDAHVDPLAATHHGIPVAAHAPSPEELSFDAPSTGEWHVEWELGPCNWTDEAGIPRSGVRWHRHPLGTEYAELYQP